MRLRAKAGVELPSGGPEVWFAIGVAYALLYAQSRDTVITSLNDGAHKKGSKHYSDRAVDLRTKHLPGEAEKVSFALEMKKLLDPLGFDVILEYLGGTNEHLHLEFDPKAGERLILPA